MSRFVLETLEPRVLLNAAPMEIGAGLSAIVEQPAASSEQLSVPDPSLVTGHASLGSEPSAISHLLSAPDSHHELVVIDAAVEDQAALLAGVDPRFEVLRLDAVRDGVSQLAEALAGRSGLDAIHLISHGSQGTLQLGSTLLTTQSMTSLYAGALAAIGQALTNDGDLLVYGCDFGAGVVGQEAVVWLAALTGADVSASLDATGSVLLGGNWELEWQTGPIETDSVASGDWSRLLATFTVDSILDLNDGIPGDGFARTNIGNNELPIYVTTLRAAIQEANALAGTDTINFSIGSGLKTISPNPFLPEITSPVIINGTTQPGYVGTPLIELNGQFAGNSYGLVISAGSSTVKGLAINRFAFGSLYLRQGDGNVIQGNFVGTNAAGTQAPGGTQYGIVVTEASNNNLIGGMTTAARNLISGNSVVGIYIGAGTQGNQVQGNYIGTDMFGGFPALPNGSGVAIVDAASNTIGGTNSLSRNVISGNSQYGIQISGLSALNNQIQGNYIGTGAFGSSALGNGVVGVHILNAGTNTIGGTAAGARNVISGNAGSGIRIEGTGNSVVEGNYIGTDSVGVADLGNGLDGVNILQSANNRIGGTVSTARNVISGNNGAGVVLQGNLTTGTLVQGNYIGTNTSGTSALGNSGNGISVVGAFNNLVGDTVAGAGNRIAFNSGDGAIVTGSVSGNGFLGNEIFGNGQLGIDLGDNGVTANDVGDGDTGPNGLLNFPQLTSAVINGTTLQIQGTLASITNNPFIIIEFFSSPTVDRDPSGFGEGRTFLGRINVTTNGSGAASLSFTQASTGVTVGQWITATATSLAEIAETSEFSASLRVQASSPVLANGSTLNYTENQAATAINPAITVSDPDSANLTGATVQVTGNYQNGQDVLGFTNQLGITGSFNATTGTLTLTGTTTLANYQTALRAVTYVNTSDTPSTLARTVSYQVNDGTASSNIVTSTITVVTSKVIVTTVSDVVNGNTSSISALLANNGGDGISLREAILAANATPNISSGVQDQIRFNIGSGLQTIALTSALPTITDPVVIDASTQPGYAGMPLIELNGTNAGVGASGFVVIGGSGSLIRGFVINRFSNSGLSLSSTTGTVIEGNYIGTDAAGTTALGNGAGVVIAAGGNNVIGGTATAAGNVISGNSSYGVIVQQGSTGNLIQANFIGTNAAGTAAVGNSVYGVYVSGASNNTIGGTITGARNVVSGNGVGGIVIAGSSTSNRVQGNFVGINAAGTAALISSPFDIGITLVSGASNNVIGGTTAGARNVISGNAAGIEILDSGTTGNQVQGNYIGPNASGTGPAGSGQGVIVDSASGNLIGGLAAGAGNMIAFNSGIGVRLSTAGTGNVIEGNAIYSNGSLGIDLNLDGVTANDSGDADTGPNNLQNYPVLTAAAPGSAIISGTLNSQPNQTYTIEFFSNPAGTGDPSGFGEGRTFLGRTAVTTDASGTATFSLTLSTAVALGELITATATDPSGNTSEFSAGVAVTNSLVSSAVLNVTTNGLGTGTITSLPFGIDTTVPGAGFTESYPLNTLVALTATSTGTSTFGGWSGAGLSSSNPVLTVTMDRARTVTATFNPQNSIAPPPPVVDFVQGTSIFSRSVTITWKAPTPTPSGYLVYVGTQDGVYDPTPYFVYGNRTSLTLTKLPSVKIYFIVSAVYASGLLPLDASIEPSPVSTQSSTLLAPQAAPVGTPDTYFVPRGAGFQTTRALGVLANDTDPDGSRLTVALVAQPADGTVTLNADGSFLFTPSASFSAPTGPTSTSFTYTVSDGTSITAPITATITIVQESGRSQQGSVTPLSGLEGWTVIDQGTMLGPSSWAGTDPSYRQGSAIDTPGSGTAQLGTLLYSTDGLAQGRTDYRLTLNLSSSANGAVGVTFRYVNASNYYRFSMERDPNGDGTPADGYRRLIKMVNGTPTVLMEQSATQPATVPVTQWQPLSGDAYGPGLVYPLTLDAANSLVTGAPVTTLTVQLQDPETGLRLVDWTVTDPTPFISNGLGLYSAGNAGSYYDLLGVESLENPTQVPLEVRTTGSGVGTVTGQVGTAPTALSVPGAPVASFAPNTTVTLIAMPGSGSTFAGWKDALGNALSLPGQTINPNDPTLTFTMPGTPTFVVARFDGTPAPAVSLDVDGNGLTEALKDGLLILRYMFGFTGPALTNGLLGQGATRTDPVEIKSYLDLATSTMLDVDGNMNSNGNKVTVPEPLRDGLLVLRYLFGFHDTNLTAGLVDTANGRRPAGQIESYLHVYDPSPDPLPTSELSVPASGALSTSSGQAGQGASSTEAASVSPLASSPTPASNDLAPDSESPAIAATQLNSGSAAWVSGFVTNGAGKEEDEVLIAI